MTARSICGQAGSRIETLWDTGDTQVLGSFRRSAFRWRDVPGMNPLKWTKRDRVVALVAGVPTTVAVLVLFRYVFPVHDYLSALFFGALFGILGLVVEMLAVSVARRFVDPTA